MAELEWLLAALATAVAAYALATVVLTRRCRLPEPRQAPLLVELPTLGHHIALYHHPASPRVHHEPVLLCHGLGANHHNMDFADDGRGSARLSLARRVAAAGFDTWVLDLRGRGAARVPRGADWSLDDELQEDVPAAIETVLARSGASRLFWVGHSWGGMLGYAIQSGEHRCAESLAGLVALGSPATLRFHPKVITWLRWPALALLALLPRRLPLAWLAKLGLVLSAPLRWVGRPWQQDLATIEAPALRRVMASLADDIQRGVASRALSWAKVGRIVDIEGSSDSPRLGRITCPLLLIAGSRDRLAPPQSVSLVRDAAGSDDKTFCTFGREAGHRDDYGHGGLVLARHAPDEVFPLIESWLRERATPYQPPEAATAARS